jgi:hypothetical protein
LRSNCSRAIAANISAWLGLTFTSFLMTQQQALFPGILNNPYGFISDAGQADLWVMDPHIQYDPRFPVFTQPA